MGKVPVIQYDTATLRQQWDACALSRLNALRATYAIIYSKLTGLEKNDPLALWRFAVSTIEASADLRRNKKAKALFQHLRQFDPQFAGDPEAAHSFRSRLGQPSLRETAAALVQSAQTDAELAEQLSKLIAINEHGPISNAEFERLSPDANDAKLLFLNWIQEPFGNIPGSLAFFSDRAMAKMVHFLRCEGWLKLEREDIEPDRIRKLYRGLGLVPARPRAIRDVRWKNGVLHFVLFKTATPEGR